MYGPGTPGTTTAGIQEALNAAAERSVVVVYPGVQTANAITISKNVSLEGYYTGGHDGTVSAPSPNEIATGPITVSSANENIHSLSVTGIYIQSDQTGLLPSLTINASANGINRAFFEHLFITNGVRHMAGTNLNADSTVFRDCEIVNLGQYGLAAPAAGSATYHVSGLGSQNVNQTYFDNCLMEMPYNSSGQIYMFLLDGGPAAGSGPNFYPGFANTQFHIPQSLTSGIGTMFKLRGFGVLLQADVHGIYNEFHSPMQIVMALAADCTDPQIHIDWDSRINGGDNNGVLPNNLVNITAPSSEYGFVSIRGSQTFGNVALPGTWPTTNTSQLVVDMHLKQPQNMGWNIATPALPTGIGATHSVTNATTQRVRVYEAAGTGQNIHDDQGTNVALPSLVPAFELEPLESIYYTGSVPTSWRWYGLG